MVVIRPYFGGWTAVLLAAKQLGVAPYLRQLLLGHIIARMNKGRAGGGVLLRAAGTPHIRLAKILPGFLEYVPQHAARTKEGPIYEAREASYDDGGWYT